MRQVERAIATDDDARIRCLRHDLADVQVLRIAAVVHAEGLQALPFDEVLTQLVIDAAQVPYINTAAGIQQRLRAVLHLQLRAEPATQ